MQLYEYKQLPNPKAVIDYLASCEWSAAKFLARMLGTDTYTAMAGENPLVFFLMDGENVVSFATLTQQDAIDDPALYPWIGFVHTDPKYRGHRYSGVVIQHAVALAKAEGYRNVYIETGEVGLYEKYGFIYLENRTDRWGEDARVYQLALNDVPEKK